MTRIYSYYKKIVFAMWILSSVICTAIGIGTGFFYNGGITYNGSNIKMVLMGIYVILGILFALIGIGTYLKKRVILILVVPYSIFSAWYFADRVFTEYIWAKYVYQSTFMLSLNILTLHILIFSRNEGVRNV